MNKFKILLVSVLCLVSLSFVARAENLQNSKVLEEKAISQKSDVANKVLWTCPMHPQVREKHKGNCPICGMNLVPVKSAAKSSAKGQSSKDSGKSPAKSGNAASHSQHNEGNGNALWTCPMHPQVREKHKGNCPICGMNLVPVKSAAKSSAKDQSSKESGKSPAKSEVKDSSALWTCPMHPQVREKHKGHCPICGMFLVPVKSTAKSSAKPAAGDNSKASKGKASAKAGEKGTSTSVEKSTTKSEEKSTSKSSTKAPAKSKASSKSSVKSSANSAEDSDNQPATLTQNANSEENYSEQSSEETPDEEQHNHAVAGNSAKTTIWTCSMHPQIRQDHPGHCPLCGMDLVPLKSTDYQADSNAVHISKEAMALADISTVKVQRRAIQKVLKLYGNLAADEALLYTQSAHFPMRIESLNNCYVGDYVQKGEVIAKIYSPELISAEKELLEAKKQSPSLFNAVKEKLRNWKISDSLINDIIQKNKVQDSFPLLAEYSGYVKKLYVQMGDYLNMSKPIISIENTSKIWAVLNLYDSDIKWVKKGDKAEISISSYPSETFSARITYISPFVDPQSRTSYARVELDNPQMKLKPQMYLQAKLYCSLAGEKNNLIIPKTAVLWTGTRSVVYVKTQNANDISFKLRRVELLGAAGDYYIVKSGLKQGEEIAAKGSFSIDSAAQLEAKENMMSDASESE